MDADAPYVCVFDLETQEKIDDMVGKYREDRIRKLSISCGSALCIPSELCLNPANAERALEMATMKTFWVDEEGPTSLQALTELIAGAELNCTYNGISFDNLVIEKYFQDRALNRQARMRQLDVFARVRDVTGSWCVCV